jgi:hypothetical protein
VPVRAVQRGLPTWVRSRVERPSVAGELSTGAKYKSPEGAKEAYAIPNAPAPRIRQTRGSIRFREVRAFVLSAPSDLNYRGVDVSSSLAQRGASISRLLGNGWIVIVWG